MSENLEFANRKETVCVFLSFFPFLLLSEIRCSGMLCVCVCVQGITRISRISVVVGTKRNTSLFLCWLHVTIPWFMCVRSYRNTAPPEDPRSYHVEVVCVCVDIYLYVKALVMLTLVLSQASV